jgi:hypothetical protein
LRKAGRNAEAVERIAVICLQTIGLPFDLVNRSAVREREPLLEHSVDNLSPDEQAVYRPKLEALIVDLKRGDP